MYSLCCFLVGRSCVGEAVEELSVDGLLLGRFCVGVFGAVAPEQSVSFVCEVSERDLLILLELPIGDRDLL